MGYSVKSVVLYQEDEFNKKPTNPKNFRIKTTSFDLKGERETKEVRYLGNGHEPSHALQGRFKYAGNIGFELGSDNLPFFLQGVIGKAKTIENASTKTWKKNTAYTKGEVVNHSDGTHSLVCYKAGTSGATIPDVAGKKEKEIVVDNDVKWFVMPLLKKRSGQLEPCMTSWGIQREDTVSCGQAETHYELFTGVIMDSLELKKEGSEISYEISQGLISADGIDNFKEPSYTPLTNEKDLKENPFNADDLVIEFSSDGTNWEKPQYIDSINLKIEQDREIKIGIGADRPAFKGGKITGNFTGLMRKDTYEKAYENKHFKVRFIYLKATGEKTVIEFSDVKFLEPKVNIAVGEDITLDVPLSVAGTLEESSVKYTCITGIDF